MPRLELPPGEVPLDLCQLVLGLHQLLLTEGVAEGGVPVGTEELVQRVELADGEDAPHLGHRPVHVGQVAPVRPMSQWYAARLRGTPPRPIPVTEGVRRAPRPAVGRTMQG